MAGGLPKSTRARAWLLAGLHDFMCRAGAEADEYSISACVSMGAGQRRGACRGSLNMVGPGCRALVWKAALVSLTRPSQPALNQRSSRRSVIVELEQAHTSRWRSNSLETQTILRPLRHCDALIARTFRCPNPVIMQPRRDPGLPTSRGREDAYPQGNLRDPQVSSGAMSALRMAIALCRAGRTIVARDTSERGSICPHMDT